MQEIHEELVRRWRPHVEAAEISGLSWEEMRAIMALALQAKAGRDGFCYIPVPANPIHQKLLRSLVVEVLETCGLPILIMETRIPKE